MIWQKGMALLWEATGYIKLCSWALFLSALFWVGALGGYGIHQIRTASSDSKPSTPSNGTAWRTLPNPSSRTTDALAATSETCRTKSSGCVNWSDESLTTEQPITP